MDNRKINPKFKAWAEELIEKEPALEYIKNSDVRLVFLESDFERKKRNTKTLGECEKVQNKNRWAIDYDFTITIFLSNVQGLTDEQIKIVLFHELLHVGIEAKEDGTPNYYIVPHDLADFKYIINRFGVNYAASGEKV